MESARNGFRARTVTVMILVALACAPAPAAAQIAGPAPRATAPKLPSDLFERLPAAPRPHPAARDRDALLVGSAVAMLAVAVSTLLLLAQAHGVRRELRLTAGRAVRAR